VIKHKKQAYKKNFWAAVRYHKHSQSSINIVKEEKWKAFYNNIMPVRNKSKSYFDVRYPQLDSKITMKELEDSIRKLKANKSPGPDSISNEFYKNLSAESRTCLLKVLNHILDSECIPQDWSLSSTTMLYKKGPQDNPANYRPITLLNCSLKLFTQIICERLTTWAEENHLISEEQAGFR